jgi:hypothetical protein
MAIILEDVVTDPKAVEVLGFKSEYEFVTGRSPLNGSIMVLPENASIIDEVVKYCEQNYQTRPLICFLDEH